MEEGSPAPLLRQIAVDLRPKQENERADIEPEHDEADRAERPVYGGCPREMGDIDGIEQGKEAPPQGGEERAWQVSPQLPPEQGTAPPRRGVQQSEDGVLIPIRLSEYHGLRPGDSLSALDSALETHTVPITGIFDNHFGNLVFFTPSCYEKVFGTRAAPNCFLVRTDGMSLEELENKVNGVEGFLELRDAAGDRARIERMSSVLNAAIVMLLGLAAVMAYFIVMNLSVTYIQKKTRELTIMRINGFTVQECVRYVAWDLVVTTLAGIVLGLIAGHFLGLQVLPVTEGPYMRFVHDPDLRTYLYAALITAGFSLLVSSTALRRVKDLKLSDI